MAGDTESNAFRPLVEPYPIDISVTRWGRFVPEQGNNLNIVHEENDAVRQLNQEVARLHRELAEIRKSRAWRVVARLQKIINPMRRVLKREKKKITKQELFPLDLGLLDLFFDPTAYAENSDQEETSRVELFQHYLREGFYSRRSPCLGFDADYYLEKNADVVVARINPLVHFVKYGFQEGRLPCAKASILPPSRYQSGSAESTSEVPQPELVTKACTYLKDLSDLLRDDPQIESVAEDEELGPVKTPKIISSELLGYSRKWFQISKTAAPRVNIVTDSVAGHSLFGGVATALILGNFLSLELGLGLRILTNDQSSRALVRRLFKSNGLMLNPHIEVSQLRGLGQDVEIISDRDVFVATSWWSAASLLPAPNSNPVVYLIQEDERTFYPTGDQYLLADRMMNNPDFLRVVNSSNLYNHLLQTGIAFSSSNSSHFEPSFSGSRKFRKDTVASTDEPRDFNLLFYGRPNHQRNLYYTGLQAIEMFLTQVRDSPLRISVTCTGDPILPNPQFANGTRMKFLGALNWDGYMKRLADFDLVLSLMASPHTSYPPLDALSVGCKVVSNTWPGKPNASELGNGIYLASAHPDDIASELNRAVEDLRLERRSGVTVPADTHPRYQKEWREQLDSTLAFLCSQFEEISR